MGTIIDGTEIAKIWEEETKKQIENLETTPFLTTLLIGSSYSSELYIKIKKTHCKRLGINNEIFRFSNKSEEKEIINFIKYLNWDNEIDAILIQLPLDKKFNTERVTQSVDPKKDVDGFTYINVGKYFVSQDPIFIPATALGIMRIFKYYNISLAGKNSTIIGRSNIVGIPLASLLLNNNSTVTICHSKTLNLEKITRRADILVSAVGKQKFVSVDMVKEGSIVIDVGTSRANNGRVSGDVDFQQVKNKVKYITPVPGGVGPLTVAALMENVLKAHLMKRYK